MDERIELLAEVPPARRGGVSLAVIVSVVVHTLLVIYLVHAYHPVAASGPAPPIARYVELMRQQPDQQFTEAPGQKIDRAPQSAALSDANRRASMPKPTGDQPTQRPGGSGVYVPQMQRGDTRPRTQPSPSVQQSAQQQSGQQASIPAYDPQRQQSSASDLTYRQPTQASTANSHIDWRNAIKEVGKVASLGGGQQGLDLGNGGGEKGFAAEGPISFETQWYDWGPYAESMVSRIRVNWYSIMPELIRTGMQGVVTIRFTIHRDGRISDVTILSTSGIPPYDFAAKKAIENASPLNPLPKDFPNDTERVTAMFYYNMQPPNR